MLSAAVAVESHEIRIQLRWGSPDMNLYYDRGRTGQILLLGDVNWLVTCGESFDKSLTEGEWSGVREYHDKVADAEIDDVCSCCSEDELVVEEEEELATLEAQENANLALDEREAARVKRSRNRLAALRENMSEEELRDEQEMIERAKERDTKSVKHTAKLKNLEGTGPGSDGRPSADEQIAAA